MLKPVSPSFLFSLILPSGRYLLPVLPPAAVQALDDGGGVAEDEGEAGGPGDHGDHGEPEVSHVLRGEPAVADAEHVRHRLEAAVLS